MEVIIGFVEQVVMEDCRLVVHYIAFKIDISIGSVESIFYENLKISSRCVPEMLTDEHKSAQVAISQQMLTCDAVMNCAFFLSVVMMDEMWNPFLNPKMKCQSAQWKHTVSVPLKNFQVIASAEKFTVPMFWNIEDTILMHCVPKGGTTITANLYENFLRRKLPLLE